MLSLVFAILVAVLVLVGPIFIGVIERNVELFFLLVGVAIAFFMRQFNAALVRAALTEPLSFTLAVMVFGATFRLFRDYLDQLLSRALLELGPRILCFSLAIILGFLAALITPVVSALIFVEVISLLRYDRWAEIAATVFGCFAIGFGSSLTPLGMPVAVIILSALHADFWYLARLLGPFVIVGVPVAALPILFLPLNPSRPLDAVEEKDSWRLVLLARPGKVYVFIAGLVALSAGFRPVFAAYIDRVSNVLLYWMNSISAVLDNATLAAIEIGPALSLNQQRSALLGLLISGGALVTGNIPNIVAASRLGITSREWARIGLGTGAVLLILCFIILRWTES